VGGTVLGRSRLLARASERSSPYGRLLSRVRHLLQAAPKIRPKEGQPGLLRDIFGPLPFRPVVFSPARRTDTALSLARQMYDSREFSAMPILADALQDTGCDSTDILDHCRGPGPHVRGCWVVDLVFGKE
jgi:hypothetical protein